MVTQRMGWTPKAQAKVKTDEPASRETRRIGRSGGTPMAAIRNKCLDCCCWNWAEVRDCIATDCSLHPYRFGKRPATLAKRAAKKLEAAA